MEPEHSGEGTFDPRHIAVWHTVNEASLTAELHSYNEQLLMEIFGNVFHFQPNDGE